MPKKRISVEANMSKPRSALRLSILSTYEAWEALRECWVKAFFNYPLFTYAVPDGSKRESFLRAYLNANYEVTVACGKAVAMGVHLNETIDPRQKKEIQGLIGGVIIEYPSASVCTNEEDEIYRRSYKKCKLDEISEEGMRRITKYDSWESSTVTVKVLQPGVPVFNGLFCAILPEYTSLGLAGSTVVAECLRMLTRIWSQQKQSDLSKTPRSRRTRKVNFPTIDLNSPVELSNNRKPTEKQPLQETHHSPANSQRRSHSVLSATSMMLMGICQSPQAEAFYKAGGFKKAFETVYRDEDFSFPVSVFVIDISKDAIPSK